MDPGSTEQSASATSPLPLARPQREPVNFRSVLLGLFGVIALNAITPFNNHALNNGCLIRSYLPMGLVLFLMLFVLLVNGPLHRFAPRYAFSPSELAVVIGMILVGCALPSSGLMRYLPGHLTSIFHHAAQRPEFADLLRRVNPPDWLFPTFPSSDPVQRGNDPIVQQYVGRAFTDTDTFAAHFMAVPWRAWLRPAIAWGILLVGLFGSILTSMIILRRQWVENERLQFPLVTVYMSLIEAPPPGRMLNTLFRNYLFWIGFSVIAFIKLFNGLGVYFPRNVPEIPLSFDLSRIMTEEPWRYCQSEFMSQRIFFTIAGLAVFMQTRTAFSLWFVFVLVQVARMAAGMRQTDITEPMAQDQMFGSVVVFVGIVLYIARHHLLAVLRQMFGAGRRDDPRGRYLPYGLAGWAWVGCQLLLIGWLMAAGTTLIGALVIIGILLMLHVALARIVADTGMIYPSLPVPLAHPYDVAAVTIPALPHTTPGSYLFARVFSGIFAADMRQTLPPFAQHALVVADHTGCTGAGTGAAGWRKGIRVVAVLVLALAIAYVVSGVAMLYVEYRYASTLDRSNRAPLNYWTGNNLVPDTVLGPSVRYTVTGIQPVRHSRLLHIGIGAGITGALGALRLTVTNWPLHPVGFLLCYTYGLWVSWFSIFLGWLAKTLLINFGGARMFSRAQPLFLGVICADVAISAFWSLASIALWSTGFEFRVIP